MAVTQRASQQAADAAPLWLPRHDAVVVEQSSARPPDFVEGYALKNRLFATLLGSRWKIATSAATVLAFIMFIAVLPSLVGAGIGGLLKLAFYQSWTIGLMLIVTARVRSVSVGMVARYWLAGMLTVAMIAYFANGPLANLVSPSEVWITPILEEFLKATPFVVALIMGRHMWRHPGLSDLMLIGFAIGGGYAFHEDGLWERAAVSGFEANAGLFVPSIFQPDGIFVVGHAVWTSLIGLAIGLLLLHRHQPFAVVAAASTLFAAVGDHMAINDAEGTLGWVRQLLFNGKLLAVLFLAGVAAAVVLDQRRQRATAARDHLFPSDRSHGTRALEPDEDDLLQPLLAARYRRLRNGIHNTIEATSQQWPPRSEAHTAPLAELARLGRAADVAVGPGTSSSGWAPDPESPAGFRFVGPNGFTAYGAGDVVVEAGPEAIAAALPELDDPEADDPELDDPEADDPEADDPELDDAARAKLEKQLEKQAAKAAKQAAKEANKAEKAAAKSAKAAGVGPTITNLSVPKARVEASGVATKTRAKDYWQYLGLGIVAVGLFVFVRLITAGDASTALIETSLSLPYATNSPALIPGLLGAVAAAVSLRGRNSAQLGAGWEVGPGDDPRPDRPDECEA